MNPKLGAVKEHADEARYHPIKLTTLSLGAVIFAFGLFLEPVWIAISGLALVSMATGQILSYWGTGNER